ncbi:hypothetical protein CULT_1450013 [[Clostridium] ultunense Esp]|nr:hypothetical protein CULT_1450013 [[Clostridium] ultunense Esp]
MKAVTEDLLKNALNIYNTNEEYFKRILTKTFRNGKSQNDHKG